MRKTLAFLICGAALLATAGASAMECTATRFEDANYSYCTVPVGDDLRLFLNDTDGNILGGFRAINSMLAEEDRTLVFATNAGMYHPDRRPVGYYVEDGKQYASLTSGGGYGNFGLEPNGLLCIKSGAFEVIETLAFRADPRDCTYATQSGPMLVVDGSLHPKFLPTSTSRLIRNGVGTSEDGQTAVFAISDSRVNFHAFARFFRDYLKLPNALFLDGRVSRIYAPDLGRSDLGASFGPIVGVVTDR